MFTLPFSLSSSSSSFSSSASHFNRMSSISNLVSLFLAQRLFHFFQPFSLFLIYCNNLFFIFISTHFAILPSHFPPLSPLNPTPISVPPPFLHILPLHSFSSIYFFFTYTSVLGLPSSSSLSFFIPSLLSIFEYFPTVCNVERFFLYHPSFVTIFLIFQIISVSFIFPFIILFKGRRNISKRKHTKKNFSMF